MFTISKPDKYFCLLSHIFVSACVQWVWRYWLCCTVSSSLILDSWMCPTVPVSSVHTVHFPTITVRIFGLYRVFNWLLGMLSAHLSFITRPGVVPRSPPQLRPSWGSCSLVVTNGLILATTSYPYFSVKIKDFLSINKKFMVSMKYFLWRILGFSATSKAWLKIHVFSLPFPELYQSYTIFPSTPISWIPDIYLM